MPENDPNLNSSNTELAKEINLILNKRTNRAAEDFEKLYSIYKKNPDNFKNIVFQKDSADVAQRDELSSEFALFLLTFDINKITPTEAHHFLQFMADIFKDFNTIILKPN